MRTQDQLGKIELNPTILGGKPIIAGTRIPVHLILNLLAHGYDFDRIIEAYPILEEKDIKGAVEYAEKRLKREEIKPLPVKS